MPQPLVFYFYDSIIEVPIPDVSLDMQYLINQVRDTEDELSPSLAYSKIADASGKDDLGGGISTAITVRLLDNWRVRFEARSELTQCTISGGNLVGGPGGNPIAPSTNTQVIKLASSSGTIATPATSNENVNLKYLIGTIPGTQKIVGNILYWNPISGSDANNGQTPATAVQTFAKAQELATNANHDVIFALSSDPSGITTVTEKITITKNTLKLRGPGYVFKMVPTSSGADTITISADNVEISGLYIATYSSGSNDALSINGDYITLKDCWVANARGHGINVTSSKSLKIDSCVVENCGSGTANGINLGDATTWASIYRSIIYHNTNGVLLSGTGLTDNVIEDCLIYKNSSYGVNIGNNVARTTVRGGNTIVNNTSGSTLNNGTDSYIETPAEGASETEIADAVWDEVLATHTNTGSAAKILKDAKVRATLASLKR